MRLRSLMSQLFDEHEHKIPVKLTEKEVRKIGGVGKVRARTCID
jgi:hypothetical protein